MVDFTQTRPARLHMPVVRRGVNWSHKLIWKVKKTGVPIDLTGITADMMVRESVDAETVLHHLTTANGKIVIVGIEGSITFSLDDTETAPVIWTEAVFDVVMTTAIGYKFQFGYGTLKSAKVVTRP